jgi:hypothetical protein
MLQGEEIFVPVAYQYRSITTRGIFVTERAGTPFWKVFLRRMQLETAFGNIPFKGTAQLTPVFGRIFGHSMRSGTFLFRKNRSDYNIYIIAILIAVSAVIEGYCIILF